MIMGGCPGLAAAIISMRLGLLCSRCGDSVRIANIRTGFVYVISDIGAFGPDIVKIGMTRRLEPWTASGNSVMPSVAAGGALPVDR
jgi:hypothetical protein